MENNLTISCPECGHRFSPEAAIEKHLRTQLQKEFTEKLNASTRSIEETAKAMAQSEFQEKMKALEKEAQAKSRQLREFEKQALQLAEKEKELSKREERAEIDFRKRLIEVEAKVRTEAEALAREKAEVELQEQRIQLQRERDSIELRIKKKASEEIEKVRAEDQLKVAELQLRLDEQIRLAEEMKRKGDQGSVQLQGEVQELAIEDFLSTSFPRDEVEEVAKGARGADCLHIVRDSLGNESGRILYESKRTKSFSKDWIRKLKEDIRLRQADIGVIVTNAMPAGLQHFGILDGIWICSFADFKSVSLLLHQTMLKIGEVMIASENRGSKMQLLYDYLTGNEFHQKIDAIREAFEQMGADLQKERSQALANFAKREKQILKVVENTVSLYGDIKGIAGGAVQSIPKLEFENEADAFLKEATKLS